MARKQGQFFDEIRKQDRQAQKDQINLTVSDRIKGLRELYGIKLVDFVNEISDISGYSDRQISKYCRGNEMIPLNMLTLIADYFSMKIDNTYYIPEKRPKGGYAARLDKDGFSHRISLDFLLGREDFKTYDAKFICEYTGLSENAVERLRGIYQADYTFKKLHVEYIGKGNRPLISIFNAIKMPFINFFLTSDILLEFARSFWRFSFDDFVKLAEVNGDEVREIKGQLVQTTDDNLDDNSPLPMDSIFNKAIFKNEMDILIGKMSDDFREYYTSGHVERLKDFIL